ncbi:MAG: hypothetical protein ACK5UO_00570 [Microcystis sp.]|jgi:hypothetical protein|uniref:hypothetical protein n=2 Tax=unclassified Microcystis TaxID=2643300 RepID=UPI0022C47168|nr:hypothetical protein [Microcystis sp. LE19-41.2A]MCZ8049793.1 hypothetical protein [Microcystis sp. LE19-41.2A]MCZ8290272.1 hypothetical protein [Microcystis sp. LE19-59.1C]
MKPLLRAYLKKLFWRGIMVKNQQLVATKAVDEVSDVTNVNDPYNIAKQGGKHSGFYNEYAKKPDSQIRKGIESINKQIYEYRIC